MKESKEGRRPADAAPSLRRSLMIGSSPQMMEVYRTIASLQNSRTTVLIVGESGTGKELVAQNIHQSSDRKDRPFVAINCGALSEGLLESELFGHVKGSFTGAVSDKKGFFEEATGGTIFLDEIGETSANFQVRLLRVLQEQEVRRVGGNKTVKVDVRVIAASNRDLAAMVKAGKFREDLYYGISGVCLRLPPLRQRKEDIPVLRDWFLSAAARDFCRAVPALSSETQNFFLEYNWPGNIRELKDAARAIVALGDETLAMGGLRSLLRRVDHGANGEKISLKDAARAASREAEREIILQVLTRTRWNRRRAAQELQISYKALLYKLKQIGYEEYGA
jgi:transcriptional regulator with PAS, ATPase and Fis domain